MCECLEIGEVGGVHSYLSMCLGNRADHLMTAQKKHHLLSVPPSSCVWTVLMKLYYEMRKSFIHRVSPGSQVNKGPSDKRQYTCVVLRTHYRLFVALSHRRSIIVIGKLIEVMKNILERNIMTGIVLSENLHSNH